MKWLLSEQSVVLNEILIAIEKSIHFCEHVADRSDDENHERFFRQESKKLSVFLSDIIGFIRLEGELPREPDSEKEAFEQWKVDIKALLSENGEAGFLSHYMDLQKHLLESVEAAQAKKNIPEGIEGMLKKLSRHSNEALSFLEREVLENQK